jgi:hypothetical protein
MQHSANHAPLLQEYFFTDKDIKTMFSMFDTTGRGFILPEQYAQALKSLGIEKPVTIPLPPKMDSVDKKTFLAYALKELARDSA